MSVTESSLQFPLRLVNRMFFDMVAMLKNRHWEAKRSHNDKVHNFEAGRDNS